jgi:hypothetical protein
VIDDVHDVKSHVASNLIDENLPAVEEIKSRGVSAGTTNIQSEIEEETGTGSDAATVPVTTENTIADDTSNDNDLMTSNDTTNTIPIQTNNATPVVEASGPDEEQPAPSEAGGHVLENGISGSISQDDQSSKAIIEPSTAQETAAEEAPQDVVPVSGDSSDIPAVVAGASAAGSLLVAQEVVETRDPSQIDIQSSQDNEVRNISEGIPSEPSAHDLPPRSSSPTPDAATTVESSKSPSAGSQYGTVTSDQHEQQAVQSNELRERSTASGAESSAKSSKQDVVVKDEVVAKPSAASTTPGKLTILASMVLGAYAIFKLANGAWGSRYP